MVKNKMRQEAGELSEIYMCMPTAIIRESLTIILLPQCTLTLNVMQLQSFLVLQQHCVLTKGYELVKVK